MAVDEVHEDTRTNRTRLGADRKGRKAVAKAARALQTLAIEYVAIDALRPNAYNPNRQSEHDFELLLRSMEEDGFTQPIIAHAGDDKTARGTIVDGEHRWRAAARLGMKEVPVVFVDMTVEQMRIATLRHNRARGSEDMELAVDVLRDLQSLGAMDWAQQSLMITDEELNRLLEDIPAPEALAGEAYGPSWEPDELGDATRGATDTKVLTSPAGSGRFDVAMSVAALESKREKEKAMAAAKTAEQRQMVHRDEGRALYTIKLVFAGEEAKVVRGVLGERPAETLLRMCQEAAEGS